MKICRGILCCSVVLIGVCFLAIAVKSPGLAVVGTIIACCVAANKGCKRFTTLGSARWADGDDLRKAEMLDTTSGLIIGRIRDSAPRFWQGLNILFDKRFDAVFACERFLSVFRTPEERLVRLHRVVHTACFAPVGAGKSTGVVIPFLQTCPDSCVVVDFKGELAALTAEHRRQAFGHKIVLLDPFRVATQTPDSFNPLDGVKKENPLAIDECRALAEALVVRTGQEKEPHWLDSAETWIASFLSVTAYYGEPGDRSLQTVRSLLSNPAKMAAVIELMGKSDAWQGMLCRMGAQLTHYKDKELGSTMTTTNRFLRFLDTIAIAESTKSSSFDPAELRNGKMTVYLILPPEHMRAQSALLRMWVGSMLRAVVRGGLQEQNKVHFVLDESASLGHMECLDDAIDKYRGYGVRLQFYFQSMGQLKRAFPEGQDQTLLSNTTQVFFGVNDQETAEFVSARLGEETVVVNNGGRNQGRSVSDGGGSPGSTSHSSGWNDGWGQQARRLLKPEEVAGLPVSIAITLTPGVPPVMTRLVRYYEESFVGKQPRSWFRVAAECVALLAFGLVLAAAVGQF